MKNILIVASFIFLNNATSFAQNGVLDTNFGENGKVVTDLVVGRDRSFSSAIQSDGKILLIGYAENDIENDTDIALVRYNTNGSIDNSFGSNGVVIFDSGLRERGYSVIELSNKKILVAGEASGSSILVCYKSNGAIDESFGNSGVVLTTLDKSSNISTISTQSDGKIVASGNSSYGALIIRYLTDGTIDQTFGTNGVVTVDLGTEAKYNNSMAVQQDDKILTTGFLTSEDSYDFFLIRLNKDGTLDNTFGTNGLTTTDFGNTDSGRSVGIQNDSKIIVSGSTAIGSENNFAVCRYNQDGSLDASFGNDGKVISSFGSSDTGYSMAIQNGGYIVVSGYTNSGTNHDFMLVRYDTEGILDEDFGTNGRIVTDFGDDDFSFSTLSLQNGDILASGRTGDSFALAQYKTKTPSNVLGLLNGEQKILHVYPNPVKDKLSIRYTLNRPETVSIELFELSGKSLGYLLAPQAQKIGSHNNYFNISHITHSGSAIIKLVSKSMNISEIIFIE